MRGAKPAAFGAGRYTARMEPTSGLGPFRPGPGRLPPYLAGRATEQALFRALLDDLRRGVAPPSEVVLHGPRGNGKTALLVWLQQEAEAQAGLDVVRLAPADVPTAPRLLQAIRPWWMQFPLPRRFSVPGFGLERGEERPARLADAIRRRVRRKPLVLLLDEAHTLDPAVGRTLLNAAQEVGAALPFLLVLAGTPDLPAHLGAMNASFWSRAERLRIGRLDAAATAAAIETPLADAGIAVAAAALADVVGESHGYPYFVQLWGRAAWRQVGGASAAPRPCVTRADVDAVRPAFEEVKHAYYLDRYEELRREGLLPVARAVAEAFATRPLLTDAQMDAAIRQGLDAAAGPGGPAAAEQTLRRLGYVWRSGAEPAWEPGIPSLMDYMRERVPAPPAAAAHG